MGSFMYDHVLPVWPALFLCFGTEAIACVLMKVYFSSAERIRHSFDLASYYKSLCIVQGTVEACEKRIASSVGLGYFLHVSVEDGHKALVPVPEEIALSCRMGSRVNLYTDGRFYAMQKEVLAQQCRDSRSMGLFVSALLAVLAAVSLFTIFFGFVGFLFSVIFSVLAYVFV